MKQGGRTHVGIIARQGRASGRATRGPGRGIAVTLGAEGAAVYATGRSSSTREQRLDNDRPETVWYYGT